jgi:hypothetical protein
MTKPISTADDATYAGTGGTFFISVDAYLSLGVYTLIIETEGVDPNSFNCGQQNDLGIGQDAPAGNGIDLGTNPSMSGEGCFSGADDLDIYAFSMNDNENFDLVFDADTSLPFTGHNPRCWRQPHRFSRQHKLRNGLPNPRHRV